METFKCKKCGKERINYDYRQTTKFCSSKCANQRPSSSIRFWKSVEKTTTCWNWTGSRTTFGYGCIQFDGRLIGAHRASWIIHKGLIPTDKQVLHSCDNPRCVNPSHLRLGNQKDNVRDIYRRNRKRGILSIEEVKKIREMRNSGLSQQRIGALFGRSQTTIGRIFQNVRWGWVAT